MAVEEMQRYRFSTKTGVMADTSTGQPVGRVLRIADDPRRPRSHVRWAVRCNCHPTTLLTVGRIAIYRTRTAAEAGLVAHLGGEG